MTGRAGVEVETVKGIKVTLSRRMGRTEEERSKVIGEGRRFIFKVGDFWTCLKAGERR